MEPVFFNRKIPWGKLPSPEISSSLHMVRETALSDYSSLSSTSLKVFLIGVSPSISVFE